MQLRLATSPRVISAAGEATALGPRDAALLAWLALEGPTPRLRLAQLFWPGSQPEAARNALRQRLFQLKRLLGVDLVVGGATLELAGGVTHDLADSDSVLGDAELPFGAELGAWLAQQRQRRRTRLGQSLVELSELAERSGDYADALVHAWEQLALEPLSEAAHRRVIRLHYLGGDPTAALLAFDRCELMLKDEIGARPSAQTLALLATVTAAQSAAVAPLPTVLPASVLRPPRLIGRDAELAALRVGWAAGQVVALIGEAGLGKTRLLQAHVETHPGVVRAAARPGDAGVPFATLARLLRALTRRDATPSQPCDAMPADTRSDIARVLPGFDLSSPRPGGEGQRLVLQRALRGLLGAEASLVGLVVDDLHFADAASLDMLRALIDDEAHSDEDNGSMAVRASPLHWALAYRPADAGTPVRDLHDALVEQARLAPVELQPLGQAGLAQLVDSLSLPGVVGATLAPGLLRRTGGNPLFVLEVLKQAWVDRSLSRLADPNVLPRPLSVGRLIERRIAQLSPAALLLARVASIAGVDFSVDLAEAVLGVPALQLSDALNELAAAQVFKDDAFAHDLVFEVVLHGVPAAVARNTHGKIAAFLEASTAEAARVAMHWVAAGRDAEALPWLGRAAQAALAAQRFKEFCDFLAHKARIEERLGQHEAAFDSLCLIVRNQEYFDASATKLDQVCDDLDRLAPSPRHQAHADLLRCHVHRYVFDSAPALAAGRRAWQTAQQLEDAALVAQCRLTLGTVLGLHDAFDEALVHFEAGLGWLEHGGSPAELIDHHGNVALIYDNLGRPEEARLHHERVLALLQRQPDNLNLCLALNNFAVNRIDAGDFRAASVQLLQALRVAGSGESARADEAVVQLMLVLCELHTGHFSQALLRLDTAEPAMRELNAERVPVATVRRAHGWLLLGQHARAGQVLQSLREQGDVVLVAAFWGHVLGERLRRALGKPAGDGLVQAEALLPPSGRPDLRLPLRVERAARLLPADALATLDAIVSEATAVGFHGHALAALLRVAEIASATEPTRALAAAKRAHELAANCEPAMLDRAELWLQPARAAQAAGDTTQAQRWCAEGSAWLRETAALHVPAEFRDSFLNRNQVNRELLALAARLNS